MLTATNENKWADETMNMSAHAPTLEAHQHHPTPSRAAKVSARVPAAIGQPTAKEILQAQYIRGEITREQYELMKQDIG